MHEKDKISQSLPNDPLIDLLRAVQTGGTHLRLQGKGSSMSPFIRNGDILTIAPRGSLRPYRYGQIVAFIHPQNGRLVIHRVVGKKKEFYVLQGDNHLEADGLISRESILGSVTSVERNGRRIPLGLGPERFLIAFLSRRQLLSPLASLVWRVMHRMRKKGMKRRIRFPEVRKEKGECS